MEILNSAHEAVMAKLPLAQATSNPSGHTSSMTRADVKGAIPAQTCTHMFTCLGIGQTSVVEMLL